MTAREFVGYFWHSVSDAKRLELVEELFKEGAEAQREASVDRIKAAWYAPGSSDPAVAAEQTRAWKIAEDVAVLPLAEMPK